MMSFFLLLERYVQEKSLLGLQMIDGGMLSTHNINLELVPWNFKSGEHVETLKIRSIWTGTDSDGGDWGDRSPNAYEINIIHHNSVQFGKQRSRCKAILSSIVLSQQCCEVCFISPTVAKPLRDLTTTYY